MATFKATKNASTTQSNSKNTFKATRNAGYDRNYVYKLQYSNKSALDIINEYNKKVQNGEWLSPDDRTRYQSAVETFAQTGANLRGVSRYYGTNYTLDEEKGWWDTVSSLKQGYTSIDDFYKQFGDENQYKGWQEVENQYNQYNSVLNNGNFNDYYNAGVGVANPNQSDLFWNKYNRDSVGNMVTLAESGVLDKAFNNGDMDISDTGDIDANGSALLNLAGLITTYMTEDEKKTYNYYIGSGDKAKAEEYLDWLVENKLKPRQAGRISENTNGNIGELLIAFQSGMQSGMQGINNAFQAVFNTGNLSNTSSTQLAAAYNKQDNSGVWGVVNDLAETTGNMTPSLLVGMLNPTAGAITMGVSSGGNAYATMINEGYKPWQALLYGGLVGTSEALLGEALGGITKLGGGKGVVQKTLSKIMPSVNSAALRVVVQVGAKAASEFTEEALQTFLDPYLKHIATVGEADIDPASVEEIFYSGFLGALSAGVLEGPSAIANGVSINQRAQKAYGGDASTIVADALNVNPNNKTAQMAQTRLDKGKSVSGLALNEIVNSTDRTKVQSAIKSRLTELGETGDVSKLSELLTKKVMGEELSLFEKANIKDSNYGKRVLNELNPDNIMSDQYSTAWSEGIGTRAFNPEVYNLRPTTAQTNTNQSTTQATQTASTQSKSGGVVVDTTEGKTTINKVNEDSTVELANGKTVNTSDVKIADTNADLVFKTATERIGQTYTNESATAMIKGYESSGVMSAPEFIKAWDEAYNLGKNNELTKGLKNIINSGVSEQAAFTAYELGKNSVLQTQANSGIINTEQSSEVTNEGEDTYLRNGGEWNGSANSQGQISTVEGSTRQNQSGTETRRFADSEAARLVNEGREVSVADLGILGGAKNYKVRLLDGVQETTLMKKGRKYAENRGLKVKYFAGNNLFIYDKSGKLIEANGYISNGYIFVRADHDKFTSNQILRHEVGHDMVAKGEIDIDKVRQKIKERFKTDKEVDQVAEYYAEAYHMAFSTQEEIDAIWEEVICDSLADMNVFSGSKQWAEAAEHMGMTIPAVQKAVSEGKANQTRGAPDKSLSKSRDTKGGWGKKFGTAQEALNDAIQNIDEKLWNAFNKELDSNTTNHPITNAINAVMHDVRQDKITPMQGAMLLSQAYKDGGIDGLSKLYNHKTGNLFDNVLERAKQIGEGKASKEFWYPQLTQNEWNLLNYRLKRELYSEENFIDSSTKWLYAESKGTKVFAIYGIGDGTEATVLYAVGGKTAETLNNRRVEYEQNINRTERNPYKKSLDRIGVQQYKYGDSTNRNGQNVPTTNRGVGPVSTGQQRGYNGGTVSTNSKQVKYSREIDSSGNELTKEQTEYFKDSKVRDDEGNLFVVYHGSTNKFTEFKHSKIGVHGTSLGRGFYFTEDTNLASSYYQEGGQLLQGYLDIKKPLVDGAKTISKTDVTKLIKAICESEAKYLVENDGSYDNVNDAIKDTFISNYVNTYNTPMANAYREMAEQVYRYNDSDADIIGELINGGAGAARVLGEVRKALGYDGVIFKHPDGVHEFVAFESNQFKNIDNKNPTTNPDIRFSRELDTDYLDAVKSGDMETAQKMVDEVAKEAGYTVKAYHGTKAFGFTSIDVAQSDDGISFFATDSLDTAGTYSVDKRVKRIVDKGEYVSDEQIESMEEDGYDIAVDIADWCNRTLGIQGWADEESIHKKLETIFVDAENENISDEDISSKIYEIYDDMYFEFSQAYYEQNYEDNPYLDDDEYMDWEEWESSEENDKLSDKFYSNVDKIINIAQALLNVNGGLGIYSLYMNTDNHLVVDCKGEKWNKITADNLPDIKSADYSKYGYRSNREYWTTRSVAKYAKDNGYNGVTFKNVIDTGSGEYDVATVYISFNPRKEVKSADPVTYDDERNVIPLSERFNPDNVDIRFSRELELEDYDAENEVKVMSNRELLVNSLESTAQNEAEKEKLAEYKGRIDMLNAEEKKLAQLKSELKELTFGKGAKDAARAKALREEIVKTENRINLHDKKLLQLESTKSLKDVLEREKSKAYKRAAEKGREALHRNVEGRHKTAERNRIRDIAHELDTLLNKGTKKKNVKIGQQDVISKVLDVTDMLFASDDELILNGIKTQVTSAEQSAIDKYKKLYAEYHDTDNAVTEHKEERKAIRHEMDEIKKQFADVLERERQRISNLKASSAFDALIEEYKKLASSDKTYIRDTFDNDTLKMLEQLKEDVGDTTVSNMTLEQLKTIRKALTMMKKMVQNTNKLFKSAKNETIEALGSKAQSEIEKHGHKDKLNKLQKGYASFDWNNLKPIYLLERTDSSVLQELGQAIFDAESDWASDMLEARIFWDKMEAKYNATKWNLDKSYTFTNATGQTYSLTLEQIMSVYAYSKRGKQAIDHLKTDGFVFDETTEVKGKGGLKYELNDKTAYKITEPNLIEIVSKLTPEQKSYVDEMQKYLSEVMGAKGNEVSRELYGIDLFGEENYFPIRSEGAYLERVRQQAKGETKIKNKGFTKETQKGARNAIVLSDFSKVWSEHVAEMSSYHTFTLPLEDFYRVYNYQTTSDVNINKQGVIPALENAYGKAATKAIDDLLNDINGGARFDIREQFGKEMLRLYKVGKTMLSLSVVVQQPTSILRAQAMIDPKYFVGEKIGDTKRKELWNELKQYAPVAIIKEMGYFDVGMGRSSADWLTATDYQGWGKVKGFFTDSEYRAEVFSKPASKADELTWVTIWNAVKRETARNNPALNTSSETFLNMAGKRFEDIIRHTQVYDSTLSRSSYMRNKSVYAQMVTSFMAEPTTSINMREMAMRSKNKNRILRTTAAVYSATLLNALLVALPYAMRDDDEDETFLEKYITAFSTSFIDNINPLTSLPFVKDAWSILQGYDVDRADMTLASDLINSFERFTMACVNQEGVFDNLVSLIGDLSAFTGIPIDNVIRDVKSVFNMLKTVEKDKERATTWNSLADALEEAFHDETPVWNWFSGETKSRKLYDALVAGDEKYVARFRSTYKTEEEYYSAVRKSLRDNDPRMREAAQAYLDKNYTVYNQLRDEIVAEGVFNKTLVTDALKAEINYLKRKAEEAEE